MKSSRTKLERYRRQTILEQVGEEGQAALGAARVLIVGLGGLGSPVALYLAAAGVGTLGLVDFDLVELSNLQRQMIFSESQVGQPKVMAARARLLALNSALKVNVHKLALNQANAVELIAGYDLVVDCSDNFAARYAINDACLALGKPFVFGSLYRFEGQVSFFCHEEAPCYRCFYPDLEQGGSDCSTAQLVPNCAEGGILGSMAGVIGSLQATEVLKYLLGQKEDLLAGAVLMFDGLAMSFSRLGLKPRTDCLCRNAAMRGHLSGMDNGIVSGADFSTGSAAAGGAAVSISPAQLAQMLDEGEDLLLLDVRALKEHRAMRLRNSTLIPLPELTERISELDGEERPIVVYCRSGVRSRKACSLLRDCGFEDVRNLTGGILAWYREFEEKSIESDAALETY